MALLDLLLILGAAVHLAAAAQTAQVYNHCDFDVFLQAFRANELPDALTHLTTAGYYVSTLISNTSDSVVISTRQDLSQSLTLGYSVSGNVTYYDLSIDAGNPFAAYRNALTPTTDTCPRFVCDANDTECYSGGANGIRVATCAGATSLVLDLCRYPYPAAAGNVTAQGRVTLAKGDGTAQGAIEAVKAMSYGA